MIYKFGEKHVVFTYGVVKSLESYKQMKKSQHESGGVLLGKVYKDLIIVDRISEPSKEDKSGRYYFVRNVRKAQKIIEIAWEESNGERIYLGEWHTHPEDTPTPSNDDRKLLSNMLKDSHMEIDFLFMVIIGNINPYVAVQRKGQKLLEQLKNLKSTDGLDITLYENKHGKIFGFKVGGYLNLATFGYDIYNAVFSQIFIGTINSIVSLTDISDYILEEQKAFIRFVVPNRRDNDEKVFTLLDSMLIQIRMVYEDMQQKKLNNCVNIKIEKIFYS
ncbi:ribosomal-processing cysteine protease Prp [Psychrobacillus sp. FSL K6-1464]|uniref:ribosomal-processing cysteine protease Prp n=1 Tax=Psychrobacillus sp. FSL K6-1464 TaxID=2921545 RepID=UPI0030FA36B0